MADLLSMESKPVGERGAARNVLAEAGLQLTGLRSRAAGENPPDCAAMVGRRWSGIGVTELLHRKTLESSLKGKPQYFTWPKESLLRALQDPIDGKDAGKLKGGPYERYYLVIAAAEMYLYESAAREHLEGGSSKHRILTTCS